jgi:LmbE family N-acetylglucosaminyl deacetylase
MTPDTTGDLGSLLGVWAHPDDEAYLSAGLMMHAVDEGRRVVCVTATKGEAGFPDDDPRSAAERSQIRETELAACLEALGVTEHRWLGYADGGCAGVDDEEAARAIAAIVDEVRPDTVLTFGPDGITGHPDHQAVSAWVTAAFDGAAAPGARLLHSAVAERRVRRWKDLDDSLGVYLPGYPVAAVDEALEVDLLLTPDVAARKVRALAAQTTQTAGLIAALGVDRYTAWVGVESFAAAP